MLTARSSDETIKGVEGVRFPTNAEPGSDAEDRLQEIQRELAGGIDELPSGTTLPHLNYYDAATVGGPTQTYISLWAPKDQRLRGIELLEAADFTVD
jgi:hypothetical protein